MDMASGRRGVLESITVMGLTGGKELGGAGYLGSSTSEFFFGRFVAEDWRLYVQTT